MQLPEGATFSATEWEQIYRGERVISISERDFEMSKKGETGEQDRGKLQLQQKKDRDSKRKARILQDLKDKSQDRPKLISVLTS